MERVLVLLRKRINYTSVFSNYKIRILLSIIIMLLVAVFTQSYFFDKKDCSISEQEALEELKKFKNYINLRSSYVQINYQRFDSAYGRLEKHLNDLNTIDKSAFSLKMSELMGELGDRHSRVKYIGDCKENKLYLPFATAPWQGKQVIALTSKKDSGYDFLLESFPFLKSINNVNVNEYIYNHNPRDKYAPEYSKFVRGVHQLYRIHKIFPNLSQKDTLKFTFTSLDKKIDTSMFMSLSSVDRRWRDIGDDKFDINQNHIRDSMVRIFQNKVGYIKIPQMYSHRNNQEHFDWLTQIMTQYKDCNALILDIRNNPGGTRDLLVFFANYFLKKNDYWVANLARYRGKITNSANRGLQMRNLISYENHSENGKLKIKQFMRKFNPVVNIDESKFSDYVYMLLENTGESDVYHFSKPVYILMNERSFSAASVFASSFKGFPNVTLSGVSADGSSGMSEVYRLPKTELQIKMSRMLSFQRDGLLFDGYGIAPDLHIERSLEQILGRKDNQLEELIAFINKP